MKEAVSIILMLFGAVFMLIAGIGILRMPDLYTRMSATTKASTLGIGSISLAVALHFSELEIATRALAIVLFALLTSPVAAHMIGRAAYFTGVPLWQGTVIDELHGRYDRRTHALKSIRLPELERQIPDLLIYRLRVPPGSPIIGKTLAELELRKQYGVTLLAIFRGSYALVSPSGDVQLLEQDELVVLGSREQLGEFINVVYSSKE